MEIRSKERVRKLGEVFTPHWVVCRMCNAVENSSKEQGIDAFGIDKTIFEPACGNGAFLTEILRRKLQRCKTVEDVYTTTMNIFAIDIMPDNVADSKKAMREVLKEFELSDEVDLKRFNEILDKRIVQADSLKAMQEHRLGELFGVTIDYEDCLL